MGRSRLLGLMASVASLMMVTGPAKAGPHAVTVDSSAFTPSSINVAIAHSVHWLNEDDSNHRARSDEHGFFDTGVLTPSEESDDIKFRSAGKFPYHCAVNPSLTGVVKVPVHIWPGENATPTPGALVKVRVADRQMAGRVYDIQRRRDDGSWTIVRSLTSHIVLRMRPQHTGTYNFRARVHPTGNGSVSGWSPARSVFLAPPP